MLSWIEIDGEAVRHNYRQFVSVAGKQRAVPILKSNAYGHGLKEIYQALASEQPPWLGVNYVEEARTLRGLGFQGRILVVGPAVARQLPDAEDLKLDLIVGNGEVLKAWAARPNPCAIHVKFDTGMARQGFRPEDASVVATWLVPRREQVVGICTHFANVEDVTDHAYALQQLKAFAKATQAFQQAGIDCMQHAASSASTLIMKDSLFDLARVGISLYGVWPSSLTRVSYLQLNDQVLDLRPVLSWRTEVINVKPVAAGSFIGYGCTFRAIRDMRVAVLPVGYFEGYPRLAGESSSYVLIQGKRCPIVGRICMNMMMVDATHLDQVTVGEQATLVGVDGADQVTAHDVAAWAKTIHYELLSRLHPEIPRRMINA